jgi:hypothetical protein
MLALPTLSFVRLVPRACDACSPPSSYSPSGLRSSHAHAAGPAPRDPWRIPRWARNLLFPPIENMSVIVGRPVSPALYLRYLPGRCGIGRLLGRAFRASAPRSAPQAAPRCFPRAGAAAGIPR